MVEDQWEMILPKNFVEKLEIKKIFGRTVFIVVNLDEMVPLLNKVDMRHIYRGRH